MSRLYTMKNVLIDMDGTITQSRVGYEEVGFPEFVLRDLIMEETGPGESKALEQVLRMESTVPAGDPFLALAKHRIGITGKDLWKRIARDALKYFRPYDDAMDMIKMLSKVGFRLYIASNVSRSRILAMLASIGLPADLKRSRVFCEVYGHELVGCLKSSPEFYRRMMAREGLLGKETVMIGDNPHDDCLSALAAGICMSVIVNRKQKEDIKKAESAYYVKSLMLVPGLLKARSGS